MKKQETSVEKLLDIIEEKERRITELEQQVQWFMEQIRLSKRKQFGVSSEQTKIEQLNLFNEDEETHNLAVSEPQRIEVKTHYRKRTRLTTDKLPEDLPMEVIEHKLPEKDSICPDCGSLHYIVRNRNGSKTAFRFQGRQCQIGLLQPVRTGWNRYMRK
jgi:hypothetical protein